MEEEEIINTRLGLTQAPGNWQFPPSATELRNSVLTTVAVAERKTSSTKRTLTK